MIGKAELEFKNNSSLENHVVFDGVTGQSIKLKELAYRRSEKQIQKFQSNSSSEVNWGVLLSKLQDLLNVEYDEDFLEPSQYILKQIAELLYSANNNLGYEMTLPKFLVPDGEGGIRIEWRMNDKYLHLVYSEKRNYLYFQENSEGNGIKDFSANQLIEKLRWLNQK
jgi:hypothetical protein